MTRLILTTSDSGAGNLRQSGIADIVIPLGFQFIWGPLPSAGDLAMSLAARSAKDGSTVPNRLDNLNQRRRSEIERKGVGLIELCQQCETVELWIDPVPNAQLMLIQLLDHFRSHGKFASTLTLFQADVVIGNKPPEGLSEWRPPAVKILNDHLEAASMAWQAYQQPTPQHWFNLLGKISASCRSFRKPCWNCSKNFPWTRRRLERRRCGCWN